MKYFEQGNITDHSIIEILNDGDTTWTLTREKINSIFLTEYKPSISYQFVDAFKHNTHDFPGEDGNKLTWHLLSTKLTEKLIQFRRERLYCVADAIGPTFPTDIAGVIEVYCHEVELCCECRCFHLDRKFCSDNFL